MHSRSDSLSPYYPFHINTNAPTARPLAGNVTTTSATTIVAGANVVVTPASLTNILQGMELNFSAGTGAAEDVVVKNVNAVAGTFTADFVNGHSGAYNIVSMRPQYLGSLVVNAQGTTPSATFSIYNGSPLLYNGGTGTGVLIASVVVPLAGSALPQYLYNCYCSRGAFYTFTNSTGGSFTFMAVDDNVI